jgi:type II secretory pathway component PulF
MPLIITPRQLSQRAEFYQQLGQLTAAGIGLPAALQHLRQNPPSRSYAKPTGDILERLTQGYTFSESL